MPIQDNISVNTLVQEQKRISPCDGGNVAKIGRKEERKTASKEICKRHMKKIRVVYALSSFLFLIIGMCIYLLFRDLSNIILFGWMPESEFVRSVIIQLPPTILFNVLKHNFAGMFWLVSGILFCGLSGSTEPTAGIYLGVLRDGSHS